MAISIREKIMQIWKTKLENMSTDDGYETEWAYVLREPITANDYQTLWQSNAVSILDTDEVALTVETGQRRKELLVTVQIFIVVDQDADKSSELNRAIADVQDLFYSDIHTTDIDGKQYTADITELGNTKNIEFVNDFWLEAEITLAIQYTHSTDSVKVC